MTFPPASPPPENRGIPAFSPGTPREMGAPGDPAVGAYGGAPLGAPVDGQHPEEEVTAGGRAFGWVLALVIGAIFGTVGTVAHQITVSVFGASLPVGLVLALIGIAALFVGVRLLLEDRVATVLSAVGVVGMIVLFSFRSAGGSVLIPQGLTGIVWSVVPALIAVVVISWPRNLGQAPRQASPVAASGPRISA